MTRKITFAQLDEWARMTKERMDAIVAGSTDRVFEIAQTPKARGGKMPVVEGVLRNSFQASLNGTTSLSGPVAYEMVAAQMKAGDVAQGGWTAEYARRVNSGFTGTDSLGRTYNQEGAHFLEDAAMKWPTVVREETAKAKAEVR